MKYAKYFLIIGAAFLTAFLASLALVAFAPGAEVQRLLIVSMALPFILAIVVSFYIHYAPSLFKAGQSRPAQHEETHKLHEWLGVISAIVLFFICFTGAVALFDDEIALWENSNTQPSLEGPWIETDEYAQTLIEKARHIGKIGYVFVSPPRENKPYFDIAVQVPGVNAARVGLLERRHPSTGEITTRTNATLSRWLRELHSDLSLRSLNGRYVVGVLGILLLISVISGVLIHKKLIAQLFTWRLEAPPRLSWRDSHNALGAWTLVFAFISAATGAALALMKPVIPILSSLALATEPLSARDLVAGEPAPSGVSAQMMNLDELLSTAQTALDGEKPLSMRIINWDDENARAYFIWKHPKALSSPSHLELSAVTGAVISNHVSEIPGFAGRLDGALAPLHFATYANSTIGIALLKFLYALLGLATGLTCTTGVSLWLEKRRKETNTTRRIERAMVGLCAGLVVATAGAFFFAKLTSLLTVTSPFSVGQIYLVLWLLSVLWVLWIAKSDSAALRNLLFTTASLTILAAILDILFITPPFASAAFAVDISLLALGLILLTYNRAFRTS